MDIHFFLVSAWHLAFIFYIFAGESSSFSHSSSNLSFTSPTLVFLLFTPLVLWQLSTIFERQLGMLARMDMMVRTLVMGLSMYGMMGAPIWKAKDVPFQKNYVATWATDHIKYINGGTEVQLFLDKYSGTGFQSRSSYLFGHFSMRMKMVGGDSAGVVTAFYLSSGSSENDEIDFEFLGNRTNQPYALQTNVYTGGKGDREQRIYLWFDPTTQYHTYSILWNSHFIVFLVDDTPIRIFKNNKDIGVKFPSNQPMKIYSSLWNADDWATRGGLEKTDWSKAPFVASYTSFHVDGCDASSLQSALICTTSGRMWWDQMGFQDLNGPQYRRLMWVRQKYTIYNYCKDKSRYPSVPLECVRNKDI